MNTEDIKRIYRDIEDFDNQAIVFELTEEKNLLQINLQKLKDSHGIIDIRYSNKVYPFKKELLNIDKILMNDMQNFLIKNIQDKIISLDKRIYEIWREKR